MDLDTIFKILHIFGIALGAGGALISDAMFFSSVKDEKISQTELRFLTIGSRAVWAGLAILIISGLGMVWLDPANILSSEKFWAKMSIVGIILVNGIIFHIYHVPHLHRHVDIHFPSSLEFVRRIPLLLSSGVVSAISWPSALILGALRRLPYSYGQIMGVYLLILGTAILLTILFKKKIIAHPK